jgi:2-iminobutanoate/2-iminopropanoate deaminase
MIGRKEYAVAGLPAPISHYTDAVRFGDILYISGMPPLNANSELVGAGDVTAQTEQVLINLRLVLEAAGGSFGDILKVTVYVLDIADRFAINEVRKAFFGESRPASTLIEVRDLAIPGMLVEIEAVAALPVKG